MRLRRRASRRIGRVAVLSPMPPAGGDAAQAAAAMVEGLGRSGFAQRRRVDVLWPFGRGEQLRLPRYELGVYHLADDPESSGEPYRQAIRVPGLVVLHELALPGLIRSLLQERDPLGPMAVRELRRTVWPPPALVGTGPLAVPWLAHLARRSRGVLVFSDFGRRYLEAIGCRTPVFVTPPPPPEREEDLRRAEQRRDTLRASLEARGAEAVVVAPLRPGDPAELQVLAAAVGRSAPGVHLALVGRARAEPGILGALRGGPLGSRLTLRPGLPSEDLLGWILAADVVVDLAPAPRGELGGWLLRALQAGRPAVVGADGAARDLPDEVVRRVGPGRPDAEELAAALRELLQDPTRRARMGERARVHLLGGEVAGRCYGRAIEDTLALVRDPVRRALAHWAGALGDLGITEEDLLRGYGMTYVRALAELRPEGPRA